MKNNRKSIDTAKNKTDFPPIVAGIGVPADGFVSLNRFFAQMTSGHGAAFVVLHPSGSRHVGLTIEQLKDRTALTVVEAEDGIAVIPDRIYVMSSDKFLNITGCRLTFREPVECNGILMPIDHFFCSLATDLGALSCGILLSPVGSDGLLGLSELKAAGGRTFVEDPGGEASPGSPQNLPIADRVLPVDAMAAEIAALAKLAAARSRGGPAASFEFDQDLRIILDIVRTRVGHDFSDYKPSTMVRRIRRRMTLAKVAQYTDYARFLYEHPDEADLLQKDLLIGVTEFFRQPQAWENLEKMVIAPLVEKTPPGSEIRIWVPGCSTGKEAYSLAMLLMEHMEKTRNKIGFQIFATDSEAAALAVARSGIYSDAELGENVSMERRQRFFTHPDSNYQIVKEIRERIVFAPQNLMADPPFSRLDLISCRNLLIYLDQKVQQKIIALFHFSLHEGGFLFLGTAETVGEREDLFAPVSKKWRIYRRIGVGRRVGIEIPVRPAGEPPPGQGKLPQAALPPRLSLASAAHQMLLDRFAPACVMIDRKHQVLYVHGPVDNYLTFPPGELTMRVVDMVREGLRARLRGAIGKCIEVGRPVSVTARVRRKDKSVPVRAIVSPIRYPRETDGLLLITFEDYRTPAAKTRRPAPGENDVQQLEDELKVTREELQGTIEQLEGSNDQLKASNEEVTASNEELQSANEELETSKEELQSLNEELNTINARLQEKVDELETTNNDVINLLSSTSIATVFLDKDLKVRRFTPAITRLFSLIPSDIGRPVSDVLRRFSDEPLMDDARRVLTDLTPVSNAVQADDGLWYIRRITPYRTQDDRIEGVVVTFVDITDRKEAEQALRKAHDELEIRVQDRTEALVKINKTLEGEIAERKRTEAALKTERQRLHDVLDILPAYVVLLTPDYHVPFANRFFRERFGESGGRRCFEYLFERTEPCEICETYTVLKTHAPHHWEWLGPDGRNYDIFDFPFTDADGSPLIMEMGIDITELKKSQNALLEANETLEQRVAERTIKLAESEARYRNLFETMSEGFAVHELICDAEGNPSDYRFLEVNPAFERLTGLKSGEVLGRTVREILPGTEPEWLNRYGRVTLTGEPDHFESFSGELNRWYEVFAYRMEPDRFAVMFLDITGRKQIEEAIRRAKEEWEKTFDSVPDLIVVLDDQHRVVRANKAMAHRLGCTPKECIGLPCYKAVHGTDAPPAFCPHTKTIVDGKEHTEEVHEDRLGGHFLVTTTPISDETGKMTGSVHVARDITALKEAEERIKSVALFPQENPHPILRASGDGTLLYANRAADILLGQWQYQEGASLPAPVRKKLTAALKTEKRQEMEARVGAKYLSFTLVPFVERGYVNFYSSDITERKQALEERETAIEFLQIVNNSRSAHDLIRAAITFFQHQSGCRAVGIRLRKGDDYPYYEARGFSEAFILMENSLCAKDKSGNIIRDNIGEPVMECMCGNVICGRVDPSKPFFTPHGTFWTNSTTRLPASTTDMDRQTRTRNRCNGEGYESVALLPLCVGGERLGLLQLNDPREGVFSPEIIRLWERLADYLAVALAKLKAEESLRENREDLDRAQAVGRIGSWRLNVRRNELLWSDENHRIFGIPKNTPLTYEAFLAIIHPDDREYVDRMWKAAMKGESYDIEHRIIADGMVKWVREKAELEFDNQGELLGGFGTTQDITERKKQQETLQTLNRTLRALGNANEAMILAENESEFLNKVCRIIVEDCDHAMVWIGYAREDEGKSVRPVAQAGFEDGYLETLNVTWADTKRGRGPTGTAIRTGTTNICRNMTTDPRMAPWREEAVKRGYASSIALPLMADGRVLGVLTIYSRSPDPFSDDEVGLLSELADDLSFGIKVIRSRLSHRQAEESLRQSEARFRILSEIAEKLLKTEDPQGLVEILCRKVMEYLDCHAFFNFLVDEDAGKLHLNACAGIPAEEALKIQWLEYGAAVCGCAARDGLPIIAEDIPATPDPRTDLIKSYGIRAYACHPMMIQGRIIGTLSFGTKTRTSFSPEDLALMKTVTYQIATAMERMRLIEELQSYQDELEIRVEERTVQLKKTNKALEQSNKALEEFAYVASHDLQEPLRKIQTFADRLKTMQGFADDKALDYMTRMQQAAGRMRTLIRDLLVYSRLVSTPEPFTLFNLKEPVEDAIKDLMVPFDENDGSITIGELPEISADRVQMGQLFRNLIGNALKYHSGQKPVIRVYDASSASNRFHEIHVEDNGIGFDEMHLDKIFKPFQRLHGQKGPYEGTGMGLAICRRIVEHHRGSISAKSKPGKGSTFIVRLPRKGRGWTNESSG